MPVTPSLQLREWYAKHNLWTIPIARLERTFRFFEFLNFHPGKKIPVKNWHCLRLFTSRSRIILGFLSPLYSAMTPHNLRLLDFWPQENPTIYISELSEATLTSRFSKRFTQKPYDLFFGAKCPKTYEHSTRYDYSASAGRHIREPKKSMHPLPWPVTVHVRCHDTPVFARCSMVDVQRVC